MKIVVLMGGDSAERDVSLVTGDQVSRTLSENGHEVIKIDPVATRSEQTELNQSEQHWIGIEYPESDDLPLHRGSLYLHNIAVAKRLKPDVVFIALHGGKGENGNVQGMLDAAELKYTGSGRLASTLAMDKNISKIFFHNHNLPTPRGILLETPDASRKNLKKVKFPQVVKPNDQGSTIGLSIVHNPKEIDEAISAAFMVGSGVIVEDYIPGREITVSILQTRTFPVLEIIPQHGLYDYECKYKDGMSRYEVPAKIDENVAQTIRNISLKAHNALGCKGYSRVDLRLTQDNKPYILEVNTLPGMTGTSLVPKAAKAAGVNFNTLIETIVDEAIES